MPMSLPLPLECAVATDLDSTAIMRQWPTTGTIRANVCVRVFILHGSDSV